MAADPPPVPRAESADPLAATLPPEAAPAVSARAPKTTCGQILLVVLGTIAFLHFARPVVLPLVLACMVGMTLKPVVRWLSGWRIPAALSAAVVLGLLVTAVGVGFFQLGRPALAWMNEAPQRMTELRQRVQQIFPRIALVNETAVAVNNLGATEEEKRDSESKTPVVEVKDSRGTGLVIDWTGTLLVGIGETLVLAYLLLASGDLFLQKFVRLMPTLRGKKRAVEINREIQHNISGYLFSVSLINVGLGVAASAGLLFAGVPNAVMWGLLVAVLNFVPYFGPVAGVILLAAVGLLSFDTVWGRLFPPGWFLLLHLLEANFITPVLLGRRLTLHPVVIFVSLMFWTWLWGVPGALLATPILVSVKVVCDHLPALAFVGELFACRTKP
jgi:predicted PurR-regulated permease PerM